MKDLNKSIISFIREVFNAENEFIPLHEPKFIGNEKNYVNAAIDSTFVSSIGAYVDLFEKNIAQKCVSKYAIATVNGTSALHAALLVVGVKPTDEVITQSLSFVATSNAISYCGAFPIFIDVDMDTMGMSPKSLRLFLEDYAELKNGQAYNKLTGARISACLPMHTFGFPCRIDEIISLCGEYNIPVVEDAAESLGSRFKDRFTGTFGALGVFSFNGNKIITSGGGGVIVTDNEDFARMAKHITTTAKAPHEWNYYHDMLGFNYRMPNINAALACAQLEMLDDFLSSKRDLAQKYKEFFKNTSISFVIDTEHSVSNYWLMTLVCESFNAREQLLIDLNSSAIMSRPIWSLLHKLPMYANSQRDALINSHWLEERVVNIPSGVRF